MSRIDDHKPQVAAALGALDHAIERLVDALSHRPLWITVHGATDIAEAVRHACEAYAAIRYDMEDDVNRSRTCLGVIGVSAEVLARAERVNDAKAALKAVCAPLQRISVRIPVKGEEGPTRPVPLIRAILRTLQRSDLNLLAAYRRIPLLPVSPRSVTYTHAYTRAVYRKSVEELVNLLMASERPGAPRDRARLAALPRGTTHLALVREHYTNIRANVVLSRLDARGRGRLQTPAELPLMFAQGRHPEPPEVRFPAASDQDAPPERREREGQIELRPYLETLPVYRYLSTI